MNIINECVPLLKNSLQKSSNSGEPEGGAFLSRTVKSEFLRSDLRTFKELAGGWFPNDNIMTAPLLVNSSTDLIGKITQKTQADDASGGKIKKVSLPGSDDRSYGIHVVSNSNRVDKVLRKLGAPYTPSDKVDAHSILRLNNRIGEGTGRTVNDLFSSRMLKKDPEHSFYMATWLSLEVPCQPLEAVSSEDYPDWSGKRPPNINWLKSAHSPSLVSRANIDGFDFIGVPVSNAGFKAVFVMPPLRSVTSDEMEDVFIQGFCEILSNKSMSTAQLFLPRSHINMYYEKDCPEAAVAHQAVLIVDEKVGTEAAATSTRKSQDIEPVITIDRPFYFAMIDHQEPCEPRIAGMAFVKEPRETMFGRRHESWKEDKGSLVVGE